MPLQKHKDCLYNGLCIMYRPIRYYLPEYWHYIIHVLLIIVIMYFQRNYMFTVNIFTGDFTGDFTDQVG